MIIKSQISEDTAGTIAKTGGLSSVETSLIQQLSMNLINLGAPILGVSVTTTNATVPTSTLNSNGSTANQPSFTIGKPIAVTTTTQ